MTILATVRNAGIGPVELAPSSTRFRVGSAHGGALAEGVFTYLIPPRIEPGERAFAVEAMPALFVGPHAIGDVRVEPVAQPAAHPLRELSVTDVVWTLGRDGRAEVQGRVTNDSEADVTKGLVAVVLLNEGGEPIAVLYDLVDAARLAPGESREFATDYPGSPPLREADVADVQSFAYDLAARP